MPVLGRRPGRRGGRLLIVLSHGRGHRSVSPLGCIRRCRWLRWEPVGLGTGSDVPRVRHASSAVPGVWLWLWLWLLRCARKLRAARVGPQQRCAGRTGGESDLRWAARRLLMRQGRQCRAIAVDEARAADSRKGRRHGGESRSHDVAANEGASWRYRPLGLAEGAEGLVGNVEDRNRTSVAATGCQAAVRPVRVLARWRSGGGARSICDGPGKPVPPVCSIWRSHFCWPDTQRVRIGYKKRTGLGEGVKLLTTPLLKQGKDG